MGSLFPGPCSCWWPPSPFQSKLSWHLLIHKWGRAPLTFSLNSPSLCPVVFIEGGQIPSPCCARRKKASVSVPGWWVAPSCSHLSTFQWETQAVSPAWLVLALLPPWPKRGSPFPTPQHAHGAGLAGHRGAPRGQGSWPPRGMAVHLVDQGALRAPVLQLGPLPSAAPGCEGAEPELRLWGCHCPLCCQRPCRPQCCLGPARSSHPRTGEGARQGREPQFLAQGPRPGMPEQLRPPHVAETCTAQHQTSCRVLS